jgi:RimJ/RimL family protein N-acetyltransferase
MVEAPHVFPTWTETTLLRPFTLDDAQDKAHLDNDPTIRERLGQPSNLREDIAEFEEKGLGLVAVVERATGRIVGYAKLQSPDWEKRIDLELVIAVGANARRRGFGLEAAQLLFDVACGPLRKPSVVGRVATSNQGSLGLVKKLGMVKIGERVDFHDGLQHIYEKRCESA